MKTLHNEKTVTLKLKRTEVCDLLLATGIIANGSDATKWDLLHSKLKEILDDFDAVKNGEVE